MSHVILALGLVLAVEGLVLALAPRRIEDALRLIASLGLDQRRVIGLIALALGVALVWLGSPL
ncbi:MAG: DUF2065 domain-containing protein [Tabrizicola sp.]|uniref:DUF2065 domain-containing protein n=1 Tax=Tabrizicola sp. TaxID=2005166 RepID=UPI001B5A8DCA|nr:DUF2065 domain-containing protein [Tabrizicola sp.]MCC6519070.1 DUF2065 domain-containing protein [Tabrizicola sp.]